MSSNLRVEDGGRTIRVFGRTGHVEGENWTINSFADPQEVVPHRAIQTWVDTILTGQNGLASGCFLWVNAHMFRTLWLSGTVTNEHVEGAIERLIKEDASTQPGLVCQNVPFTIDGRTTHLTVVVSDRDPQSSASLVNGEIPTEGVIKTIRMEMINSGLLGGVVA